MRRLHGAWVLGLLMLFGLAVTAPAAAELRTNGRLSLDYSLQRGPTDAKWTRTIGSRIGLDAEFFPGDRDNTRVVMQMSGSSFNSSNSDKLSVVPQELKVDGSYLELTTSLWVGGPPWLVRIGDQYVGWSSLASSTWDRSGITVSNVNIGPVNTRWAYLWGGPDELATVGATASARLGPAVLNGTYIARGPRNQFIIEGTGYFFRGMVELQAGVSLDAQHVNAGRFAIGLDPIPNLSLDWRFDMRESYDPLSQDYDPQSPALRRDEWSQLAVSTQQFGTRLDARFDYDHGKHIRTSLSAQRLFFVLNRPFSASYNLTLQGDQRTHSVMANTVVDVAVFKAISLTGNYYWGGGSPPTWIAQAAYSVPGGPTFNLGYNNSQQTTYRMGVSLSF